MEKRLQTIMEEVGLTTRESRAYFAVLRKPEATLAEVARITLIPRMSCYGILRSLLQKGFVDVIVRKKRNFFVAVPPEKILERLARKQEEFQKALPRFERYAKTGSVAPQVRFIEGQAGIRAVFRRILDEKRPFAAITSVEDMEHVAQFYFEEFIRQRIRQHLKVRLLTNKSQFSVRMKERDAEELRETRFVRGGCMGNCDEECENNCDKDCRGNCCAGCGFHTAEYIFGNTVTLLSLRQSQPTALIIDDVEIAKTHALYFELLWNQAEAR